MLSSQGDDSLARTREILREDRGYKFVYDVQKNAYRFPTLEAAQDYASSMMFLDPTQFRIEEVTDEERRLSEENENLRIALAQAIASLQSFSGVDDHIQLGWGPDGMTLRDAKDILAKSYQD